ncbi:MAG: hypothetical protein NT080_03805 [Spirochaetes bacterium]|nr:hypothetical protein [Spirochaetota bacterium]
MPGEPLLDRLLPPARLAFAGAALSVALVFEPWLWARIAMLAAAALLCALGGRRVSFIRAVLVTAGIVAANLLVPVGKVLVSWGPFVVTETALFGGIEKAVTFEGLMFISKATIRPGLRLPGKFGSIVSRAFRAYGTLASTRLEPGGKGLIADLDAALLRVYTENEGGDSGDAASAGNRSAGIVGTLILAALCTLAYVPHIAALIRR